MKYLKRLLLSVVFTVLAFATVVSAENPINITISECSATNRVVTVSGNISTSRENENISLTVLNIGNSEEDFVGAANMSAAAKKVTHFDTQVLGTDGSFSFVFKMKGETGDYKVLLNSRTLSGTYETTLSFTNTVWPELNALKNSIETDALAHFKSFIETEKNSLGIDLSAYNMLSYEEKEEACRQLMLYQGDYDGVATFNREYEKVTLWLFINSNRSNAAAVQQMVLDKIEAGVEFFGSDKMTGFAEDFSDTAQLMAVTNALADPGCTSFDGFIVSLENAMLISYVKTAEYFMNLYNLIEAENNIYGFTSATLTDFSALAGKDSVVGDLYAQGKEKTSSSEIIALFDTLVANKKSEENAANNNNNNNNNNNKTESSRPVVSGGGGSGGFSANIPVATPKPITPEETQNPTKPDESDKVDFFKDLSDVEWAKEAINYLAAEGVLSGKGNGVFDPGSYMTREEVVKMLDNAFGYSKEAFRSNFDDVSSEAWYYAAICGAVHKGIINGYEDNTFGVGKLITREDAAVIMLRAAGEGAFYGIDKFEFDDIDNVSEYAKNAVGIMAGAGIINGSGNNMFMPKSNLTRAEAAKLFYELLKYIEE